MDHSYYTNIQDRREAIKEAIAVLLKHRAFQDTEGEKEFLTTCAYVDPKELVEVIFETCSDLLELHILRIMWTTHELDKRFEEEVVKQFGDVEAYKEHLINLSEGNENIQSILKEEYYYHDLRALALRGCQWAFDIEIESIIEDAQRSCFFQKDIEFCFECRKAGVNIGMMDDKLLRSLSDCNSHNHYCAHRHRFHMGHGSRSTHNQWSLFSSGGWIIPNFEIRSIEL